MRKSEQAQEPEYDIRQIKAIIGLGNPGLKYCKTRHNIGFRIVDELVEHLGGSWREGNEMAYASVTVSIPASVEVSDEQSTQFHTIYIIKPLTFMNNSGRVIPFLTKKGIKSHEILVAHDELEKKFGDIMLRLSGSARGHNGLRSIISVLGPDFWRFRFGIDRPAEQIPVGEYVLTRFLPAEEQKLSELLRQSVEMILGAR
jgi:PTH1 family peptidyl-tRNA hydrolase